MGKDFSNQWGHFYRECPKTVTDNNGAVWTRHQDPMPMCLYWTTDGLPKEVSVYATPYYDGECSVPVQVTDIESGDEIFSNAVPIDGIDVMRALKIALSLVVIEKEM